MIQTIYNRTLRSLQKKWGLRKPNYYNEVKVPEQAALTDRQYELDYKPVAISAIHDNIKSGDNVLEIGAGRGVFSVEAARTGGEVTAFEASASQCTLARLTAKANGFQDAIDIQHVCVGDPEGCNVYGEVGNAQIILVQNLPECDVMLMDCEGAEYMIIGWMGNQPNRIIVETHPNMGGQTGEILDLLNKQGYDPVSVEEMSGEYVGHIVVAEKAGDNQ